MNRNGSGLRIVMRPPGDGSQLHSVAAGIPTSLILLLGTALTFQARFPSVTAGPYTLFLGMVLLSAVLWLLQLTGNGRLISTCALVLIIALCACFYRQVLGGMGCLGNDFLNHLTARTGRIYLDFTAAKGASALWGAVPVLAVITVLLHLTVQTGKMLFFLPVSLALYAAVITGLFPLDVGAVLLGLGTILLLMRCVGSGQSFGGLPTWIAVAALCGAVSFGVAMAMGDTDAKTAQLARVIHQHLYDHDTNSMPEGDLQDLGKWSKSDTPALKITMSEPQKLYLRGQIYETYDAKGWLPLSAEDRAESESLFYWLHRSGFFGQSQIGTASAFTTQAQGQELTVENLSACSAHGYYPYALCGSEMLAADLIGDAALPAAQKMRYQPGSVPEWYAVQHALAASQGRSNIANYLLAEQAYEKYVTGADLQLTNESWSVLSRKLGNDDSPRTLSQIRTFIREFLSESLVYDEAVRTLNGSSDFLQYTLEKSGSGYSVHYATAATLMFRYFGVPARYVEGYFLSAEEAAAYSPGAPIVLTENHAHAWAEYYLPGVGFVPFEVTPGYMDDEELELGGSLSENEQTYTGEHLKYAQVEQPERIEEREQDRFSFSLKPVYLLYLLAVLLLILGIMVLMKRERFAGTMRVIDNAPNREAIALRFGYALRLLRSCDSLSADGQAQAEELNREALFSNHEMTAQQRRIMDGFAARVLAACKEKWTFSQKIRFWAWECLY